MPCGMPLLLALLLSMTPTVAVSKQTTPKPFQKDTRPFEVLTSEQIRTRLTHLAETYPRFATLTDAQTQYGLPAAGTTNDCPFERTSDFPAGCRNYILSIEDKVAHPDGSSSSQSLPEVLLVGTLHGNERVGPTAVTEAASLLLEAAECEAMSTQDADTPKAFTATLCRDQLSDRGVSDPQRKWLARLVTTRRIVIVPAANALGYYRNERGEDDMDPNRDFPFDVPPENAHMCMKTIAARTVNELFREHMFQLSITFHSGGDVQAVMYEWGDPAHLRGRSPDDEAQAQIAQGYANYAGKFGAIPKYETGPMQDVLYDIRGAMNDWAYAGSWDPDRMVQCTPTTHGGYPAKKTTYNDSMLRAFNMLVECCDERTPRNANDLGTMEELLTVNGAGNGHIARNLKLSLLAIDLVEPYVSILGADGVALADDVVPSSDRTGRACKKSKALLVSHDQGEILVEWTVGGGFAVDSTSVVYGKWEDLPNSIDGSTQPTEDDWQSLGDKVLSAEALLSAGTTRWHKDGAGPSESTLPSGQTLGPIFQAKINISTYSPGDRIAVFAVAKLDSSWTDQPDDVEPELPPQSHVVNARTNPEWRHESSGKVIQGRLEWYSIPLTLVVGSGQDDNTTVELSSRLHNASDGAFGPSGGKRRHLVLVITVTLSVLVLSLIIGALFAKRRMGRFGRFGPKGLDKSAIKIDYNDNIAPRGQAPASESFRFLRQFEMKRDTGLNSFNNSIQSMDIDKDSVFIDDNGKFCASFDSTEASSNGDNGEDGEQALDSIFWDRAEVAANAFAATIAAEGGTCS